MLYYKQIQFEPTLERIVNYCDSSRSFTSYDGMNFPFKLIAFISSLSILLLIFLFFILPSESDQLQRLSETSFTPDTGIIYNLETLDDWISSLSMEARHAYVLSRIRFDVVWPLTYALWFYAFFLLLRKKHHRMVLMFPFVSLLFDLLENALASYLLLLYPETAPVLRTLLWAFSALKWLSLILCTMILVVYLTKKIQSLIQKIMANPS